MMDSTRRPSLSLVVLLALLAPAATGPATAATCAGLVPESSWTRVDTEHFRVQGGVDEDVLHRLAVDLERLRGMLVELAPSIERTSDPEVLFHVLPGVAALAPYRPAAVPPGDPGFLIHTEEGAYGVLGAEQEIQVAQRTAYRQYLHHLLTRGEASLPLWLQYGLAETYSTFEVRDGKIQVARLNHAAKLELYRLRDRWMPLERFVSWAELPTDAATDVPGVLRQGSLLQLEGSRDDFIAQSRIFLHYLLVGQSEERGRKLPDLVRAVLEGMDSAEAFRSVYGLDVPTLDQELQLYLLEDRFPHLERPAEPWTGVTTPSRLQEHEVLADLGHLASFARPEVPDHAEAHFRCALERAPDHGSAWRGLGRVAESREDLEAALGHYRKAVEHDPGDVRSLEGVGRLLLASVSGRPKTDEDTRRIEEARAALLSSVEKEPDRGESWADLGRASLLLPETRQDAVEELTRALELLPQRSDIVSNLLLAHAQVGNRDEVEALYARLLEMDAEPQTLARAREVRYQLDFQLADALVRQDRPDDAVALYAQILTGTRNAQLAQNASERLELLARAERYNQFAEHYQEASRLLDSREPEARRQAVSLIETLESTARPGLQLRAVRALQERLEDVGH